MTDECLLDEMPLELSEGPEALEWLRQNHNPSALASNRFGTTRNAIGFVEELYRLGALKVLIPKSAILDEAQRIADEGGPYADSLTIFLPDEARTRGQLLEVAYQEARDEFGEDCLPPDQNDSQSSIFLWWD